MRSAVLGIGFSVMFGVFAACSGSDEQPQGSPGGSSGSGGTTAVNAGDDCEGRGDSFSAGMTKESENGSVSVELVRSDIAPPGQGINTWTLRLEDAGGQAIAGAALEASFRMPDHTHPPVEREGSEMQAGTYEVKPDFSMPGLWEITVTVTPS